MTDEKLIEKMARRLAILNSESEDDWEDYIDDVDAVLGVARPAIRNEALEDAAALVQVYNSAGIPTYSLPDAIRALDDE